MLVIENLTMIKNGVTILENINLEIPGEGIFLIQGSSGSGKTTLLRAINGLDPITKGKILSNGLDQSKANIWEWRRQHPLVFQDARLFEGTIEDNIIIPARYHGLEPNVEELLEKVGLEKNPRELISRLSGGEQQRVAIARALALEPRALLLDEPTSNLDMKTKLNIEKLIKELAGRDTSIIMVTHDVEQVKRLGNTGCIIENGKIVKTGKLFE